MRIVRRGRRTHRWVSTIRTVEKRSASAIPISTVVRRLNRRDIAGGYAIRLSALRFTRHVLSECLEPVWKMMSIGPAGSGQARRRDCG